MQKRRNLPSYRFAPALRDAWRQVAWIQGRWVCSQCFTYIYSYVVVSTQYFSKRRRSGACGSQNWSV